MKLFALVTNDGDYEDYQEYTLYRNTDRKIVEKVKEDLKVYFEKLLNKKIKGITDEDIEKYENFSYDEEETQALSDEKFDKINKMKMIQKKIHGLSEPEIIEIEYNNIPRMKDIAKIVGI
jgi:DNA-directed RNA polymerase specialized sigma subunit